MIKEVFLEQNKINYIFIHKADENIFQSQEKGYLKQVFENDKISIYQIKK